MPIYNLDDVRVLSEYEAKYTISVYSLEETIADFGEEEIFYTITDRLLDNFNDAVATHALEARLEDVHTTIYRNYDTDMLEFKMIWLPKNRSVLLVGGDNDGYVTVLPKIGDPFQIESDTYVLSGWTNAGHWIYSVVS